MMFRKLFVLWSVLGWALAGLAAESGRPNILFAISDDQSWPHASAYGCDWVKTPAFDRVAEHGILFHQAFTPNPKCAPSRACILTGRHSWLLEDAANHFCAFPEKFAVFTELLGEHGYEVAYTGKGWGPGTPGKYPDGSPRTLTGRRVEKHQIKPPAGGISGKDYARNFESFLAERPKDRPFFFWYGAHEPHRGYAYGSGVKKGGKQLSEIDEVPPFWPDNETVRNDLLDYAFEIEWFDHHLDRMLKTLEREGLLDNTLVVVTADNGMPFPRVKGQLYEHDAHLPLAAMWPAKIQPGREVIDLVSFVDFAPTFLELAGVDRHPQMTGKSLVPLMLGAPKLPLREVLLGGKERHDLGRPNHSGYPIRTLRDQQYLYLHNYEPAWWPAGDPGLYYRNVDGSPTLKLIVAAYDRGENAWWNLCLGRRPGDELYDLVNDPYCINNLAGDPAHAARATAMRQRMEEALRTQGDPRMNGEGACFDRYEYVGAGERKMVEGMLQVIEESGGKVRYMSRGGGKTVPNPHWESEAAAP